MDGARDQRHIQNPPNGGGRVHQFEPSAAGGQSSFWASPAEVLRRYAAGELQLAPPTHRTLEVLSAARDARAAVALADAASVDPICPRLVPHHDASGETMALVLPGDPEHEVRESRSPGKSRFVLRGDRFFPEDAPAAAGPSA